MRIEGSVALVTGAASGLGHATTRRLLEGGASVVAVDLDRRRLDRLATELSAEKFEPVAADVTDPEQVGNAVDAAVSRFGSLHIAVNCAGVADAAKTVSKGNPFPLDLWNKVIGVNLTGTFNVVRLASLAMTRNEPNADGERGVIINTSSGAAWQGQMGQAAYSASKAGVIGLTLPVARDLASHGIRVVAIAPGLFDTDMVAGLSPQVAQAIIDKMILFPNRMGRADEFAAVVRSIVETAYFNATTINLDGGARIAGK